MGKRLLVILVFSLPLLCGCDAMRKLAGRPTSDEIEARRVALMQQQEAEHMRRIDSLRQEERRVADSLAMIDSLRQMRGTILNPAKLGGLFTTKLDFRYYIVVGAFANRINAESLLNVAKEKGYVPTIINFRSGLYAVGICPSDNLNAVYSDLLKVKKESFCPSDVWILVNE